MNIAVLGTGMVGTTIGSKLIHTGHKVKMGSRSSTNEKAAVWVTSSGANASHGTFAEAAKFGELIFNCTSGIGAVDALKAAGSENLKGKIIIDISNPLDFSKGMPPTLTVCNTDSLGEALQRTFPEAKVVKTLNTLTCFLMVNPSLVQGDHNIFISGNDGDAKTTVKQHLHDWFGWKSENVIDLGDITSSRGTEQLLPLWIRLYGIFQNPVFNFNILKGSIPKS